MCQQVTCALVKVNSPMARSLSYENLLPLVVSIINNFSNVTEVQPNKQLAVTVSLCQLLTMALETVDKIHWQLPQTSANFPVQVPRHKCDCSLYMNRIRTAEHHSTAIRTRCCA